jgi:hypothetical protein
VNEGLPAGGPQSQVNDVRNRKLDPDQAFEEYLVYQLRLFEYLQMFQIGLDIIEGRYKPESALGHGPDDFGTTVRGCVAGLFASLMDKQGDALNVFDVWAELYPEDCRAEILGVWKAIKSTVKIIRAYRNNVAFHANKKLKEYLKGRGGFYERRGEVVEAMQQFWGLAAKLIKEQRRIPDFERRLDGTLKKNLPDASPEKLRKLKDYFIRS